MAFLILAGLKFSRKDIGEVGNNEKDMIPVLIMIFINVLLASVLAFFFENGGSGGFSDLGLTGINAAIAELGSGLIGVFFKVIILALVMRIFKVKPTIVGTLRVWGACVIWSIIGDIVGLFLTLFLPSLGMLSILFWLLFSIALMIGLTCYTEAKYWQSLLSIVIAFAVIFGIMMGYGKLLELIFV